MSTLTTIIANPRLGSRTHRLAGTVAQTVAAAVGIDEVETVDLALLGAGLLDPADERPAQAREVVAASDLLLVATPVYKATYTGLLKVFLDGYGANALAGVTAAGVVVSAAPAHLLATDIHLRSLLVELGATVPTRSLGVLEPQLENGQGVVDDWTESNAAVLRRLVGAAARQQVSA